MKINLEGKCFLVTSDRVTADRGKMEREITMRQIADKPKQDIRDYCRERRLWGAKDYAADTWYLYTSRPILRATGNWFGPTIGRASTDHFIFPDVSYALSLITPDGEMPLLEPNNKKQGLHRGDPIFVWDDEIPDTIPAHIEYFHHFDDGRVVDFDWYEYGRPHNQWDHYRRFDAALVGVPRKDWPKEEA